MKVRNKIGSPYEEGGKRVLFVLVLAFIVSLATMIPYIVYDGGYFLMYGDFNVQQYPFYMHGHDAILAGETGWDFKTDLGVSFIGSYSFYNIGSPFFYLTLLLPSGAVPYAIGPLLALKIGCAAAAGYAYIRRFTRYDDYAVLGGLMYAFSGYSIFNMFFNHFHEPMVFFPLMLIALEELAVNNRKGWFAVTVALNAYVNYYFFVAEVVFTLIYFFVRMRMSAEWKITPRKFAVMAFEAVLGFGMAGVMVLPSVWEVAKNPRAEEKLYGWNAVVYPNSQRYLNILEAFFFPPDLPARPNFTPDSNTKWGSLAAWLPLFGMTGVIAWLRNRKGHWLRRVIIICFFMAFIPLLNSVFQLFSATYYARWFFMFTLMTSLATVMAMSNEDIDWDGAMKWSVGITLAIALPLGLMLKTEGDPSQNKEAEFGLITYKDRFWIYVAIVMLSLMLVSLLIRHINEKDVKSVFSVGMAGIVGVYFCTVFIFVGQGKTLSYDSREYVIPYALSRAEEIELEDLHTAKYRVDFCKDMDNMGMFWDTSCIQAFHSIVPSSVIKFYNSVGVDRGVGSRPELERYAIRSLLSVRYLFDNAEKGRFSFDHAGQLTTTDPQMPGWTYVDTMAGYNIWENDCYIPMGFCYEYYVTERDYEESFSQSDRGNLMLRAIVLSDEQELHYGDLLRPLPSELTSFTENGYKEDCRARAATACADFTPDKDGFSASIDLEAPNLVFFSVPYHEGWSASIGGRPVELQKVNVGFMAVVCPAGHSDIRFDFRTPLLNLGKGTSAACIAAFLVYYLFVAYDPDGGPDNRFRRIVRRLRKACRLPAPATVPAAEEAVPERTDEFGEEELS
jgi:Bacterial membrane protein YfhO.